jgi:hypothetical protein
VFGSNKCQWVYRLIRPSWTIDVRSNTKNKIPTDKKKPVLTYAEPPFLTSPYSADDGG